MVGIWSWPLFSFFIALGWVGVAPEESQVRAINRKDNVWKFLAPRDDLPPPILPGHYPEEPIINRLVDLTGSKLQRGVPLPAGKPPVVEGNVETVVKVVVVTEVVDAPMVTVIEDNPSATSAKEPTKPTPSAKPTPTVKKPSPSSAAVKPTPTKKADPSTPAKPKPTPTKPTATPTKPKPSSTATKPKAQPTKKTLPAKKAQESDEEGDSPTSTKASSQSKPTKKARRVRGGPYPPRRKNRPAMRPFNINEYKSLASKSAFHLPTGADVLLTAHKIKNESQRSSLLSWWILGIILPPFLYFPL